MTRSKSLNPSFGEEKGHIRVLKNYFETYRFVSFYTKNSELKSHIRSVQADLLHEISHLYGIGNSSETNIESRKFATAFLKVLSRHILFCYGGQFHSPHRYSNDEEKREKALRESDHFRRVFDMGHPDPFSGGGDNGEYLNWFIHLPTQEGLFENEGSGSQPEKDHLRLGIFDSSFKWTNPTYINSHNQSWSESMNIYTMRKARRKIHTNVIIPSKDYTYRENEFILGMIVNDWKVIENNHPKKIYHLKNEYKSTTLHPSCNDFKESYKKNKIDITEEIIYPYNDEIRKADYYNALFKYQYTINVENWKKPTEYIKCSGEFYLSCKITGPSYKEEFKNIDIEKLEEWFGNKDKTYE
jgi:hypothetical protein